MREGGGWIGYAVTTPLVSLMTSVLTYPVLIIVFIFGLLVVTATPVSQVLDRFTSSASWLWAKRPERPIKVEDFEIADNLTNICYYVNNRFCLYSILKVFKD